MRAAGTEFANAAVGATADGAAVAALGTERLVPVVGPAIKADKGVADDVTEAADAVAAPADADAEAETTDGDVSGKSSTGFPMQCKTESDSNLYSSMAFMLSSSLIMRPRKIKRS